MLPEFILFITCELSNMIWIKDDIYCSIWNKIRFMFMFMSIIFFKHYKCYSISKMSAHILTANPNTEKIKNIIMVVDP